MRAHHRATALPPSRQPPHPGEFLDSRFLQPLHISQDALARGMGVSRRRVNELVRGKRAITADTAIRLGLYFGTGPELWSNLQRAWDVYVAWRAMRRAEGGAANGVSGGSRTNGP